MQPVKVNIFISYDPEDKAQLAELERWLYPMQDEVNIWYYDPPERAPHLPLPWQILLFWYKPNDYREKYQAVHLLRREHAHIYLFLTSYRSLSNPGVESDIETAVIRRIKGDNHTGPFILPILLSPSTWKDTSRLAGFKAMAGEIPLTAFKPVEEGYLTVTEELSALISLLQSRLNETKFYQSRLVASEQRNRQSLDKTQPYLGELEASMTFDMPVAFQPPEWLGWSVLFFLFISFLGAILPASEALKRIYETDSPGWEFIRENPLMPPKDTLPFPDPDY